MLPSAITTATTRAVTAPAMRPRRMASPPGDAPGSTRPSRTTADAIAMMPTDRSVISTTRTAFTAPFIATLHPAVHRERRVRRRRSGDREPSLTAPAVARDADLPLADRHHP